MDYIDSQTYASTTQQITDVLDTLVSTTQETTDSIQLLTNNQESMLVLLENTATVQLGIIVALLLYILRKSLIILLVKCVHFIQRCWQVITNWTEDEKVKNIILPILGAGGWEVLKLLGRTLF